MDLSIFLYQLFSHHKILRRKQIIKLWHSPFTGFDAKKHTRPSEIFAEFIQTVLYKPVVLKLHKLHLCCFDRGSQVYQVPYNVLDKDELDFLDSLLAQNKSKRYMNGDFTCEITNGVIVKQSWRREVVREFAWLLVAKQSMYLLSELICAVQWLLLNVKQGDLFLGALHYGLQRPSVVKEVPCWHLDWYDYHEEDIANQSLVRGIDSQK